MQFTGDSPGDLLGHSVSDVDELNADGVRDLFIGAPFDDPSGSNSGSAHVYSGADGVQLYSFAGQAAGDQFGYAVASAGDVNADGTGDLLVGAWLADFGGMDAGRAYVFSGLDGSALFVFDGDSAGEHLGAALCGGGDVDGNGHDDLVLGSPADSNAGANSGSIRVMSGLDGTVLHSLDGSAAGDAFGTSVAGAADFNGDSLADFVVGAPYDDHAAADAGRVTAHSGADASVIHTFDGQIGGDQLGIAVGSMSDINSDGRPEVITSAWLANSNGADSGRVLVRSGSDGTILLTLDGDVAGAGLGKGGAVDVQDVNGDGLADLLIGVPYSDGSGANSGSAVVYSGFDGSRLFTFQNSTAGDWLGHSVSSAGDVNGDGLGDLLVGVPLDDDNGNLSGSAFVFLGSCWQENYCVATINSSGGAATMSTEGSLSISANDLVLVAEPCPKHQFGFFFYGSTRVQIPLGHGYLCVGAGTVGLQRLVPVAQVNNQNIARYFVDFTLPPMNSGAGQVFSGSTWNFQFWFRDPPAGSPTYNLTDAVAITFCD